MRCPKRGGWASQRPEGAKEWGETGTALLEALPRATDVLSRALQELGQRVRLALDEIAPRP